MFREKRFWHPHHFPPPTMPFGPGMIKEMSQLVYLWTISEESQGITGYDLQKNYHTKQTNVYRTLKEMEEEELLESEETIEGGRAQKLYSITDKGKEYLKDLREKWTYRIAFLTDIVPPEHFPVHTQSPPSHELLRYVNEFNNRDEALAFLSDLNTRYNTRKNQLQNRLERLDRYLKETNEATLKIRSIKDSDSEEIKEILRQLLSRRKL